MDTNLTEKPTPEATFNSYAHPRIRYLNKGFITEGKELLVVKIPTRLYPGPRVVSCIMASCPNWPGRRGVLELSPAYGTKEPLL